VINPRKTKDLECFAVEAICLLELNFPPGFFDTMTHLPLHLPLQLALCGPVHLYWCYGIERYLGVLTSHVRDQSKPEACMASGYMIDESMGFCTEYFALYKHTKKGIWNSDQELKDTNKVIQGKPKRQVLTVHQKNQIHEYVINHSLHTSELLR
jgi:hypothetical protein